MYYPGLFESATSYTALNSAVTSSASNSVSSFGKLVEGGQSVGQKIEPHGLLGESGKKMLSTPSLEGSSSFHYRPLTGAPTDHHMMTSAYVPPVTESLGASFRHDQSFLEYEASTPYGISPLSTYSYPSYLGNAVIGSTMKAPSSGTYPGHTSFYPPSGSTYSTYPDSFISEYITRNHIDANKAAYNSSTSDSSSFTEHLKRLQESFQSKSPKTCDSATSFQHPQYRPSSTHSAHTATYGNTQPVRPEPILLQPCSTFPKSTVISNNYPHHSYEAFNKVGTCENPHKSTSTHLKNPTHSSISEGVSFQQKLSNDNQNFVSATNCKTGDSVDQTIENCIAGNDLIFAAENSLQHTKESSKTVELKVSSVNFLGCLSTFMRHFVSLK